MNSRRAGLSLLLGLLLPLALFAADAKKPGRPVPAAVITKLGWLAGHWRAEKSGRVIEEQWMAPAGGVMFGIGRTVAKGKVVEYEFVQIREGPGGDLFYIALPSGQKETTFKMASLADNEVVFENPEHDFPKKVGYTLQPGGSLLAFIEGPGPDGAVKRIEFSYQKIP